MKVTLLKGNLSSAKLVMLDTVVERIKGEEQARRVGELREMIPYSFRLQRASMETV